MSNICWSQLLKCEALLLLFVIYDEMSLLVLDC